MRHDLTSTLIGVSLLADHRVNTNWSSSCEVYYIIALMSSTIVAMDTTRPTCGGSGAGVHTKVDV